MWHAIIVERILEGAVSNLQCGVCREGSVVLGLCSTLFFRIASAKNPEECRG